MKINELFEKYSKKKKKETNDDARRWKTTLDEVMLEETNLEAGLPPEQDHGIGLNQDHRIGSDMLEGFGTAQPPALDKSSRFNSEHLAMFDKSTLNNVVHGQT